MPMSLPGCVCVCACVQYVYKKLFIHRVFCATAHNIHNARPQDSGMCDVFHGSVQHKNIYRLFRFTDDLINNQ